MSRSRPPGPVPRAPSRRRARIGGLLVQNLLGRGLAAAGIAIDPAPIKGVLPLPFSAQRVAFVA